MKEIYDFVVVMLSGLCYLLFCLDDIKSLSTVEVIM
jgi:hypothetical protein